MNYWILVQDSPRAMQRWGTGAVTVGPGQYLLRFETEAQLKAHPVVLRPIELEAVINALPQSEKLKREQAYMHKEAEFTAFLNIEGYREAGADLTDPNLIDPVAYPYLEAEYWKTYDLSAASPWDIARAGLTHVDHSVSEADRRREKLLCLKKINESDPDIPDES